MLKILSLDFQLVGISFQKKSFWIFIPWYVFFPLGGYVDQVVDNRTNYQEYKYV